MKTLLLARHGKSSWDNDSIDDFERPLNQRGLADAPVMAKRLNEMDIQVDRLITSDAIRAYSTAEIYAQALQIQLMHEHSLYQASSYDIVAQAKKLQDHLSAVMLVGHNPGMQEAVDYFCPGSIEDMPTCSIAIIRFDVAHWVAISPASAELVSFEYPKK